MSVSTPLLPQEDSGSISGIWLAEGPSATEFSLHHCGCLGALWSRALDRERFLGLVEGGERVRGVVGHHRLLQGVVAHGCHGLVIEWSNGESWQKVRDVQPRQSLCGWTSTVCLCSLACGLRFTEFTSVKHPCMRLCLRFCGRCLVLSVLVAVNYYFSRHPNPLFTWQCRFASMMVSQLFSYELLAARSVSFKATGFALSVKMAFLALPFCLILIFCFTRNGGISVVPACGGTGPKDELCVANITDFSGQLLNCMLRGENVANGTNIANMTTSTYTTNCAVTMQRIFCFALEGLVLIIYSLRHLRIHRRERVSAMSDLESLCGLQPLPSSVEREALVTQFDRRCQQSLRIVEAWEVESPELDQGLTYPESLIYDLTRDLPKYDLMVTS